MVNVWMIATIVILAALILICWKNYKALKRAKFYGD